MKKIKLQEARAEALKAVRSKIGELIRIKLRMLVGDYDQAQSLAKSMGHKDIASMIKGGDV
jgi:hypothetical protein